MELPWLQELVLIFLLSIGVTVACAKLKLPSTVAFLLTGVLCGPSLLGVVGDVAAVGHVAELGVAMLMFTIGIELSGDSLNRLKRPVFLGGGLQIALTVLALVGLVVVYGQSWQQGVLWGCLVALSSSAIVLRLLQERGLTSTPAGHLSLAILVFQDIMVAPMLLAVPLLAGKLELTLASAFTAVVQMGLMLGGVLLFARYGVNRLMEVVVRSRTREVLLLTTLGLCMGMALLTSSLGLSLSLGAFLAGLMLARSQYSMSVIAGILPYRDVFMSLFFISVGMMLDLKFCLSHFFPIAGLTILFILVKAALTLPSVLLQGYPLRASIITSLSLAQVGEFSFVLAASGLEAGLLQMYDYQTFLSMSIITMMLTPLMIGVAPRLGDLAAKFTGKHVVPEEERSATGHNLEDHLIIIGFGISGKHLAKAARESGIDYVILEMNPETVSRYAGKEPITHGDASQPVVLEHLGAGKARVLAIVISDPSAVRAITLEARRMNLSLHIVARTRFVTEIGPLRQLGADDVIAEEFESSIEVFSRVLTQYLVPSQDIDKFAAHFRQENYRTLRRISAVNPLDAVVGRLQDMGVQTIRVAPESSLCGLSLAESELRGKHGVTVVAVQRQGVVTASPGPETRFEADDVVYLFGKTDKLYAVRSLIAACPSERDETRVIGQASETA
ncbi:MAG: cation:proton antiporter [Desulfovibrio sp.]|jgi:CPA2 family monovalent cation:H+ antiporter-2|nr:cation:proton antiporter [Desulfovibrio sp.]